jgi:hypothetical protein
MRLKKKCSWKEIIFWIFANSVFFNNYIYTGSDFYLQINGIGMGTSYSGTAANICFYFFMNLITLLAIVFVLFLLDI